MEVEIIRKEIFTVGETELDDYGNLTVTDTAGKTHKVNAKHKPIHPVFELGMAVEVGYGEYMQKEFIHTARQVKEGLPAPVSKERGTETTKPSNNISPQELGMWFKEMGECLRKDGFFTADIQPIIKRHYLSRMYHVCGVKIEDLKK